MIRLRDEVKYVEGVVVTKKLLEKKCGNVTLFAFVEGQKLSEQVLPHDALIHVVEGEAEVRIGEEDLKLREGEAVVIPANFPHTLKASKRFKMILTTMKR